MVKVSHVGVRPYVAQMPLRAVRKMLVTNTVEGRMGRKAHLERGLKSMWGTHSYGWPLRYLEPWVPEGTDSTLAMQSGSIHQPMRRHRPCGRDIKGEGLIVVDDDLRPRRSLHADFTRNLARRGSFLLDLSVRT